MKKEILFLASNPNGMSKLALDEECREIGQKIRSAEHRDSLELISRWAVRPDDLLQYLNELKPHLVHFSGHGTLDEEIVLMDKDRNAKAVSARALKQLFTTLKDNIRVVMLNACFSQAQAEAITEVIDCAIGMKRDIGDQAAITFAAAFYRAVGFGRSVQEAFDQGKSALMLEGIPEENTPILLVRNGVDPNTVVVLDQPRGVIATVEFTLDRPLASFDPDSFKAALRSSTGVDVSKVRIASIRPGSTKVLIVGDPQVLRKIIGSFESSQQVLNEFAKATNLQSLVWSIDGTQYELVVSESTELARHQTRKRNAANPRTTEALISVVYEELLKLAKSKLANMSSGETLQPTELVHEAWLRLRDTDQKWNSRTHFIATAAMAMHRILIDGVRRKLSKRQGGGQQQVKVEDIEIPLADVADEILAVDEALNSFRASHPIEAMVVELHYFGGLSIDEIANYLGVSQRMATRHNKFAQAWLYKELNIKKSSNRD